MSAAEIAVAVGLMAVFAYIEGRPSKGESGSGGGKNQGNGSGSEDSGGSGSGDSGGSGSGSGSGSGGKDTGSGDSGGSGSGGGNVGNKTNRIPDNNSTIKHIFRDAEGHISDTPENRALLEDVANNVENFLGTDKYGNEWYTKILEDGRQVWVESRNGSIFEGGINEIPKSWNPNTGLKKQ